MRNHIILVVLLTVFMQGCLLTKVVTVPMRVVGAVVSAVPIVGETADDAMDGAAAAVDKIPL